MSERVQPIADPGIATLSEVLDPNALARHLRAHAVFPWNGGAVEQLQVHVLKRKIGSRWTLEIGLQSENGWQAVIGKVHATDRSDVYQAMEGIRQAGFGLQDEFSIPQPLAYLPSLRLLVQEKVEGPLATEVLRATNEGTRAAVVERCARWLARFHAHAPKTGPVFDSCCCLRLIRQRSLRIAELGGRCAEMAARLLQQLEEAACFLSPVEMRAGHGSYSAAQLILAERRTAVFDWDGYDVADPARDVGRFLAALRRLALGRLGSIRALDGEAEVFLSTYRAEGQPEVERNLRFYEAAACVKLAKYKVNDSVPHWQEKTEAMLEEGLRVLDREVSR